MTPWKSKITLAALVPALAIMVGCAQAPTQTALANANYGPDVTQEDCERIAQEAIGARMKDAGAAQYRFGTCEKGWMPSVPMFSMPIQYGYVQRGEVNGKNSFGGYVGFRPFYVLIRSDNAIRAAIDDGTGMALPWRP